MTNTTKLISSCTEYLLCVQHCKIHAEIPNTKRIQALPWPSEVSAHERDKQVATFPGTSGLLPRILTYIKDSGVHSISQSMSSGLLVVQGANSFIHKQRAFLINHIWKSLGKQDSLLQDLSSAFVKHMEGSPKSNQPGNLSLRHPMEGEELQKIYLGQCWSALPWVRSECNISRACLAVFPRISFSSYLLSPESIRFHVPMPPISWGLHTMGKSWHFTSKKGLEALWLEILLWMYMIYRLLNMINPSKGLFLRKWILYGCLSVGVCTCSGAFFYFSSQKSSYLFLPCVSSFWKTTDYTC